VSNDAFTFPHLKPGGTAQQYQYNAQLLSHLKNEHMKKIAKELEIYKPFTTYYARYSFTTILKNSGVSTEFICEELGHTAVLDLAGQSRVLVTNKGSLVILIVDWYQSVFALMCKSHNRTSESY
jgi:ABC-type dipeptide/oligopeptide/nickel transport system permease component